MPGKSDQDNSPFLNAQIPILNGRRVKIEVYASTGTVASLHSLNRFDGLSYDLHSKAVQPLMSNRRFVRSLHPYSQGLTHTVIVS